MLRFAAAALDTAGHISDEHLADARAAGLDDTALFDIVAVVIENCLGNFVNNIARTEVDGILERSLPRALPSLTRIP